jgi:surface antigen/LysM repeat protein
LAILVFLLPISKFASRLKGFSIISIKPFFSYIVEFFGKIDFKGLNTRLHLRQRAIAEFVKRHRTVKLLHIFRKYSAFSVVVSSALLVSATNIASGKSSGSLLFGYWENPTENAAIANSGKINGQKDKKNDLTLVPLEKANTSVDPEAKEEEEVQSIIQGNGIIAAVGGGSPVKDPEEDGGVKMYTVESGDTLGSIAEKNHVSVNTIVWANDVSNADSIMPGDTLFILPVTGVNYKVKSGDNIDSIANKFKADKEKIIAFNDLPANGELKEGEEIVIPDGQGENPTPKPATSSGSIIDKRQYANATGGTPQVSGTILSGKGGTGHRFPYGYCTWYVAQKRYVPWSGNAGTWLYHAKAAGYATGRSPRAGAIVVTTENRYYGHVAYVEKVSGDTITISEMNYVGYAKTSRRTLSASSRVIRGFIY